MSLSRQDAKRLGVHVPGPDSERLPEAAARLKREQARARAETHQAEMRRQLRAAERFSPGWGALRWYEEEHRFAPPRNWRFDFAWPEQRIALEIEGGVSERNQGANRRSRHTSGTGYTADLLKYHSARVQHGWLVVQVTGEMVHSGKALEMLREAFEARMRE